MLQPKPYHLIVLMCCIGVGMVSGILNLIYGSEPTSRFYHLGRYIVYLLGVGLIIFSALLLLRQFWAIDGLIVFFAFSAIESLLTFRPEAQPLAKRIGTSRVLIFWIAFVSVVQGTPLALLIWLRPEFTH
jgi:hypothetical protein